MARRWGPRHCHGLDGRCDKLLLWALSLLQAGLFSSQMYVASSPHVTNPFLLEGAKREQEGLSLIPSNALKMIKNGNEMTVESRVLRPGYSFLQWAGWVWFREAHSEPAGVWQLLPPRTNILWGCSPAFLPLEKHLTLIQKRVHNSSLAMSSPAPTGRRCWAMISSHLLSAPVID